MKRIVVTGGTGFIGGYLVRALVERGDAVTVPTRDPHRAERRLPEGVRAVSWDPSGDEGWIPLVDGADAVIHLAGEQAVGVRWTDERKRAIYESRVHTTQRLVEAMRGAGRRPSALLCASGVDYYGPRTGGEEVDEEGAPGESFLAEVTQAWEEAARGADALGVRTVRTRFGVVLGRGGGALVELVKPFKLFAGGPIGTGRQVISWVHIADLVGILLRCLDDESIRGPVNVVAPSPVTSAELARTIGQILQRPWFVRAPGAALRIRFGEGAEPLLTGRRVVPRVMKEKGYVFRYPDVESALREALGREASSAR